jgi:tetratricopeptide (TPR) repeat protein
MTSTRTSNTRAWPAGTSSLPLATWLSRAFILGIPADIEEAGLVDGCSRLGGMLRSRHLMDAAAVEYEKALQLSPQDPYVTGKLARTLVELGRFDRAIELATPLAHLDESDPVPAVTLGIAHAARKQWKPAAAAFEQALRTSPFDPTTRCGLAEVYRELGDARLDREKRACTRLRS